MTDERIIAYLLEELPEEELEQFEDECFAQESWSAQINLVEEDLIDAYLRDELIPEQRQRFERNYLTTAARHERVSMAAALLRHVDEYQTTAGTATAVPQTKKTWAEWFRAFWSSQTWALRTAVALVLVVFIVGMWWLLIPRTPPPQTFATLTLTNSTNPRDKGAQASKVKSPLPADALRITLLLPQPLPPAIRARVELESDDGKISPLEIAGQDAQSVSVLIPAGQLARGQYVLNLFVIKTDGTEQRINGGYFFIVE